jgi:hypothetical protein
MSSAIQVDYALVRGEVLQALQIYDSTFSMLSPEHHHVSLAVLVEKLGVSTVSTSSSFIVILTFSFFLSFLLYYCNYLCT